MDGQAEDDDDGHAGQAGAAGWAAGAASIEQLGSALHVATAVDAPAGSEDGAVPTAPGMALVAAVLWSRFLRFDVADPGWPDRDRFVLSSGRYLPLLRALLRLTGHAPVPPGCAFGQHPAIETAAGPPGQGFAMAVGMAMAERSLAGRFGRTLVDHSTWVLAYETDLAAGVSLEAASLAGQMRLDKLVVLFHAVPAAGAEPGTDATTRFAALGWAVRRVAASDPEAIAGAIAGALRVRRPTLIACLPGAARSAVAPARQRPEIGDAWLACGRRGAGVRRSWLRRLARHRLGREFERTLSSRLPPGWQQGWRQGQDLPAGTATLDAGRHGLGLLCGLLPEMTVLHCHAGASILRGLADADAAGGTAGRMTRHLPCGVQEHAMAALLNGLSLHGSARPVVAAAFASIDRMRPALRLAAQMGQPVIYLLTGDGLSLDEDGVGWQPVEQLASLRAMPEVAVFRPADPAEVAACWELALCHDTGPSLIALNPRAPATGAVAAVADVAEPETRHRGCAQGGYVLSRGQAARHATLIATGAEVAVALQARDRLRSEGISVAVVSLPCWELFSRQPASYRAATLGEAPRIGIEAASGFGWERWLGPDGVFIGMDGFGAGAGSGTTDRPSGITPDMVTARVRRRLGLASL